MAYRQLGLLLAFAVAMYPAEVHAQTLFGDGFEESCLVDRDGDRLPDCQEVLRGLDHTSADTDGDGLEDGDEVLGTPEGLNLPAMGVDARHKDLLVEMDWDEDDRVCGQHSHQPSKAAIEEVKLFYANVHAVGIPIDGPVLRMRRGTQPLGFIDLALHERRAKAIRISEIVDAIAKLIAGHIQTRELVPVVHQRIVVRLAVATAVAAVVQPQIVAELVDDGISAEIVFGVGAIERHHAIVAPDVAVATAVVVVFPIVRMHLISEVPDPSTMGG